MEPTQLKIRRHLASGGMAHIYLAEDKNEKRLVVKRLKPEVATQTEACALFEDEIRTLKALKDVPGVVTYLGDGQDDDGRYLLMSYIDGISLADCLQSPHSAARMTETVLLSIARATLTTLKRIHTQTDANTDLNIIHRDLSPENILIDSHGSLFIIDFGVAFQATNQRHTTHGEIKGKFAYMAPEQTYANAELDQRADLYAIGLILFELATGQYAFQGPTNTDTVNAVRKGLQLDTMGQPQHISDTFWHVIQTLTAVDKNERPTCAEAVLSELEALFIEHNTQRQQRHLLAEAANHVKATLNKKQQELTSTRSTVRVMNMSSAGQETRRPQQRSRPILISLLALVGVSVITWRLWAPEPAPILTNEQEDSPADIILVEQASRKGNDDLTKKPIAKEPSKELAIETPTQRPNKAETTPPKTQRKESSQSDARPLPQKRSIKNTEAQVRQAQTGLLSIISEPWAYIYVDGQALGQTTPLLKHRLKAGRHELTLKAPAHKLFRSYTIHINANGHLEKYFDLKK